MDRAVSEAELPKPLGDGHVGKGSSFRSGGKVIDGEDGLMGVTGRPRKRYQTRTVTL